MALTGVDRVMDGEEGRNPVLTDPGARLVELYETYELPIRAYCLRRIGRADVDDLVADVFAVAWQKIDAVPDAALPWLYAVAYRLVSRHWRTSGDRDRLNDRQQLAPVATSEGVDATVVDREEQRLAVCAAAALPPLDREILRLTLWEELTPTEAALVLDITPNAAKQRAHRARRHLVREYRKLIEAAPATPIANCWGEVS